MARWETIVIAVSAGLLSGAAVAWVVTVLVIRRERVRRARERVADALGAWLAARLNLSRSAVALLTAIRALSKNGTDTVMTTLRIDEVTRARTHWHGAVDRMRSAEAALRPAEIAAAARGYDSNVVQRLTALGRVDGVALRRALNGCDGDASRFIASLRKIDKLAIDLVRSHTAQDASSHGAARSWFRRTFVVPARSLIALARSIMDHWASP